MNPTDQELYNYLSKLETSIESHLHNYCMYCIEEHCIMNKIDIEIKEDRKHLWETKQGEPK